MLIQYIRYINKLILEVYLQTKGTVFEIQDMCKFKNNDL
jgi:hypothetical protein